MDASLFEHSIDFVYDREWLASHGYLRLGDSRYIRAGDVPLRRWDVYEEMVSRGWLPSLREFGGWHPLDQQRFESQWVYGLNYNEQRVYDDEYSTFTLFPLNALKFYWLYSNPFNFNAEFSVLELYHANFLTLRAEYQPDKNEFVLVECFVQDSSTYQKLLDTHFFSCAINNSLVYVNFCGRVVLDRVSGYLDDEFRVSLDRRLVTIPELALLSQEGY